MTEGAEQKSTDNMNGRSASIARWDASVNADTVRYTSNAREAAKTTKEYHTTIRTPFLKRGRHIFNIKISKCQHVGIGIIGPDFDVWKDHWIGATRDSYGTWNNVAAYHAGAQLKNELKHDTKIKEGDIVKVDLDLYDRTFVWEINGVRIVKEVKIQFAGPVAISACLYHPDDCVKIIQYFTE